jgi:hydrogenase small subunit
MKLTRRTFCKDAAILLAGLGLNASLTPKFAVALEEMATGQAPILWLHGLACSGCSVSLLNSESPTPEDLLTRYLSLYYHQALSAATGSSALKAMETAIASGDYILVVEGAVPVGMPESCIIGDETLFSLFKRAARNAKAIVAVGSCAAFGGIPAAPPNLTGATSASSALEQAGITVPLINLPGCPCHPDWMVGNLVYTLKIGLPDLDEHLRPKRTYGELLHDTCPYFAHYQAKKFAKNLGEKGCLFKLGCQGVITHSDCSLRLWNGGTNWCIKAQAPCIGCARPDFAKDPSYPFYRMNEENNQEQV